LVHCKAVNSSFACARAIEHQQAVSAIATLFSRAGETLTIHASNKPVRLPDQVSDQDSDVHYSYLAFLPEVQLHVVHVQYWEGNTYLAVHHGTGRTQNLVGFPLPSPDRSRLLAVSAAGESRYYPNAVEVFRVAGGKFILELNYHPAPERWSPGDVQWESPTSAFIAGTCTPDLQAQRPCPAKLTFQNKRWVVAHDG
jgi:hypothetical protein